MSYFSKRYFMSRFPTLASLAGLVLTVAISTGCPEHVTDIELNKNTLSLFVGGTETLTATVTHPEAHKKNITWESSDTSVATVSNNGLVTAVGSGSATIKVTADCGDKGVYTASCAVGVSNNPEQLISQQFSEPAPTRELIEWGVNDRGSQYVFVHKLGVINEAFVGYLTGSAYYDGGPGGISLTYNAGTATTSAQSYSIRNLERVTTQVSGGVNFSVGLVFKLGGNMGFQTTWESITETTLGTSYSEMMQEAYDVQYNIPPERGAGYYALAGFTRYAVYQTTIYNAITNQIMSQDVWLAKAYGEPPISIYLVKASDNGSFSLNIMNNIGLGSLPVIQNMTQEEIERCRALANLNRTPTEYRFTNRGGEVYIQTPFNSTGWSSYQTLDTISDMFASADAYGNTMNIERMKQLGYTKVKLVLNCGFRSGYSSTFRIGMKIINKKATTATSSDWEQFEESGGHTPKTTETFNFDLSKISTGHQVYIEVRGYRTNRFADRDLYINGNRTYTWTFSDY